MKTASIGIQCLCAACGCACRYCLLHSNKKADNVEYARPKKLAQRFVEWAKNKGLPYVPYLYVAYCAEYPELADTIAFNQSNGSPFAKFLQVNGIRIRTPEETDGFLSMLSGENRHDLLRGPGVSRRLCRQGRRLRLHDDGCDPRDGAWDHVQSFGARYKGKHRHASGTVQNTAVDPGNRTDTRVPAGLSRQGLSDGACPDHTG